MANSQLITNSAGVNNVQQLQEDVGEQAYYIFTARHMPYTANDSVVPDITESVANTVYNVYDEMLFGKRLSNTDVSLMVKKNLWSSGSYYEMYDDQRGDLHDEAFYVSVEDSGSYYVFKCIDNNGNVASTDAPSAVGVGTTSFTTSDGITWKYMYTISSADYTKFATDSYIPVIANSTITNAAVDGSIEAIKVEAAGAGYNNYIANGTFSASDISVGGNPSIVSLPATASNLDDFYNNCLLKVTSGSASGEYRRISDYIVEGGFRKAVLQSAFDATLAEGDTYEVYPAVEVFNTGFTAAVNCIARAIVNASSSNSISSIEIFDVGSGYRSANTTLLVSNTVGVTTNASLRAIISPPGGHGANVASELCANKICFQTKFSNTEGNFIPASNDFRAVGIIRDPYLDGLTVTANSSLSTGTFLVGETVYQYRSRLLTDGATTIASNSTITGSSTLFDNQLRSGDKLLITDGSTNNYREVNAVTNSTSFTVTSNVSFASSAGASVYLLELSRFGEVSAVSNGAISLTKVSLAGWNSSVNTYIGISTSATISATAISHNEKASTNNFFSFVQLQRFVGTIDSGTFSADDIITQTSAIEQLTPTAYVHSVDTSGSDTLYVSNVHSIFSTNTTVSGNNSTFTISNKYTGDLVKDSGTVLYLENFQPLTRNTSTSETIKLILEL